MAQLQTQNVLGVRFRGKGIPYGGQGIPREDGEANYGFKCLKGRLDRLEEIPELRDDAALRRVVEATNRPGSPMFSVGCASGPFVDQRGHGVSGYIEFAWDSAEAISDASAYFPPFFHFARLLEKEKFDRRVSFFWEIMPANFFSQVEGLGSVDGFTCSIIVNAGLEPGENEAQKSWDDSMHLLADFLSMQATRPGRQICPIAEL